MKNKGVIIIGIMSLLVIFEGIRLVIKDFHFIDGIMIIPLIALPITLLLHLIGIVIQNMLKVKYLYLIVFLVYVVGVLIVLNMSDIDNLFDGVSGFILLFILYPSFICHVSIVIHYVYTKKTIFSADY